MARGDAVKSKMGTKNINFLAKAAKLSAFCTHCKPTINNYLAKLRGVSPDTYM